MSTEAAATLSKVGPQYRDPRHFFWMGYYIFDGFCLYAAWQKGDPVLIALLSAMFFWLPAIVLHELAHAFMAGAVGGRVTIIKLGLTQSPAGPHIPFELLGFRWELYALPISGSVRYQYPTTPDYFRTKIIFVTAAGALMNLLAAASIAPNLFSINDPRTLGLGAGWTGINVWIAILTLLPIRITHNGKPILNDGLNILKHFSITDDEIELRCFESTLRRALPGEKKIMDALSADEAIARYEAQPDQVATLLHLVDKLTGAKDPRQYTYIKLFISQPNFCPKNVAKFLDNYITESLKDGTVAGNSSFDWFSEQHVSLEDNSITVRGTRGSVLVDLGRLAEGKALLQEVLDKTESDIDKSYSLIFLALAHEATGEMNDARAQALLAKEIDPTCPALQRVAHLIEPNQQRS